jgi:hypothetical protein
MSIRYFVSISVILVCFGVDEAWPLTGTQVASACKTDEGYCDGYIAGALDAHTSVSRTLLKTTLWCTPNTITYAQSILVVRKYLQEHPEKLHYSMVSILESAMTEAFPCARQQ